DRRELRGDYQELRKDRAELRRDIRNGASKEEIFKDRQEIRDDFKEIRKDRTELQHDQGTLQSARRELKQTYGSNSFLTSAPPFCFPQHSRSIFFRKSLSSILFLLL